MSNISAAPSYPVVQDSGGLFEDDNKMRREPPPAIAAAERDDEIRQMLTARNARRAAAGRPTVDVEADVHTIPGLIDALVRSRG